MVGKGSIGIGVVLKSAKGNTSLRNEQFLVAGAPQSEFILTSQPATVKVELDRIPQYASEFVYNPLLKTVTLTDPAPIDSIISVWF